MQPRVFPHHVARASLCWEREAVRRLATGHRRSTGPSAANAIEGACSSKRLLQRVIAARHVAAARDLPVTGGGSDEVASRGEVVGRSCRRRHLAKLQELQEAAHLAKSQLCLSETSCVLLSGFLVL